MQLTVVVPEHLIREAPVAYAMLRQAPRVWTEREGETVLCACAFPDLPGQVSAAVQLLAELVQLREVRAWIGDQPVRSLTKLWSTALCYRTSLREPDARAYCSRQATRVGGEAGCARGTCEVRCPFICVRCLQVVREQGAMPAPDQWRAIARQAEVDWCPNLDLPPPGSTG